ncbi:MAG TPA: NADH-quinone oxidoreductase subunit A [Solirubrobacterales bacterium]|nr:NADH-quinone oxidoreductase subunit A [Solirubrobacterales bacterium]
MLESYLPVLVFAGLGIIVGGAFATLNLVLGPKRKRVAAVERTQAEPYESGIPVQTGPAVRFGVSFYLIAMLFILFDIEVVFLYPVGVILNAADSVFLLAEVGLFVLLLLVAFVYVWRKGALEWK